MARPALRPYAHDNARRLVPPAEVRAREPWIATVCPTCRAQPGHDCHDQAGFALWWPHGNRPVRRSVQSPAQP
jgi:hypothetical protein